MARCRVVKFRGKSEPVRFCAKKISAKKKAARKRRNRANLRAHACKAAGAPRAACRALVSR